MGVDRDNYRLALEERHEIIISMEIHALKLNFLKYGEPIPVTVRSKAWVCGRSLAGIVDSNPAGACLSVVSVVCCQVEVSALGYSLVQRRSTECGVSECDHES